MKKQISVSEDSEKYIFSMDDATAFVIRKDSLIVNSKKLYETFFKGLKAKPEYEVATLDDASKGCAYIAGEFKKIIDQTVEKIDEEWFGQSGKESDITA